MAQFFKVGNEYIDENTIQEASQKILDVLRKEERTYSMNIFILKNTIEVLENRVAEIANTKVFR